MSITSIAPLGVEPYFDFHVPLYNNYWCAGVWHHNSGKTMLARRLGDLLPPMSEAETLDVVRHFSAAGLGPLAARPGRPFRAPHHTIREAGLVGSAGVPRRPGEATLATHGVLFLDEAAELPKRVLAGLFTAVRAGSWHDMPTAPALIVGACEAEGLSRAATYFPTVIEMPAVSARDLLEGEALPSTAELRAEVAALVLTQAAVQR